MAAKMDINVVKDSFAAAKTANGDVAFEPLIKGYEEIARLYDIMGQVFHFASNDMRARIKVLNALHAENAAVYSAVVSALEYEKAQDIKKKTKSGMTSASKALMAMFWDIEFFIVMLARMAEAQDDTKMSTLARKAYDDTLAHHDALPIRTAARLACKVLPIRKEFVQKYIKQEMTEAMSLVPSTSAAVTAIHDIMKASFVKNDLMKEAMEKAEKNKAEDAAQPPIE